MQSFTEAELAVAKTVDLIAVASSLGYTPVKIGNYYTLKEMDSIRIYNRNSWCRFSRRYEKGECGGSQIDFLRVFGKMDVKEAVFWLLDFAGYFRKADIYDNARMSISNNTGPKKKFCLPRQADDNAYLYSYLMNDRAIDRDIISYFINQNLIYESMPCHNIVFKGNDKYGNTRAASMRGVFDRYGRHFKCDVSGSDKRYGFNISNDSCTKLVVFEAAIDLMSYIDIYGDFGSNMLSLGMLADEPIKTFMDEHPQISNIRFCLDNDIWGRKATEKFLKKYYQLGYEVEDFPPPQGVKDYNEWLVKIKKENVMTFDGKNGETPRYCR